MISDLHARLTADLRDKVVLVTGGAGTIGSAIAHRLTQYGCKSIRLIDHNEEKTFYLDLAFRKFPNVRTLLGDIRDRSRMVRAMQGVDYVIHAAALKHVELGEYNPFEVVNTNLTALQSLIEICLDADVGRVVFTSSDKAVNPTNVMGGSKFIGERLVIAANGYRGPHKTRLCCTRFGNVLGSAGSVLPVFARQIAAGGPVTVTEPEMTRFFMTLDESVELVLAALVSTHGGEVYVPKMHAMRLIDLAEAMVELYSGGKQIPIQHVGLRPGEKFYEELITDHEMGRCLETEKLLIVTPYLRDIGVTDDGHTYTPGPADYPDRPAKATRLFSSQTATPLDRAGVKALLEAGRKAVERVGGTL